jgi:hypothetical protein
MTSCVTEIPLNGFKWPKASPITACTRRSNNFDRTVTGLRPTRLSRAKALAFDTFATRLQIFRRTNLRTPLGTGVRNSGLHLRRSIRHRTSHSLSPEGEWLGVSSVLLVVGLLLPRTDSSPDPLGSFRLCSWISSSYFLTSAQFLVQFVQDYVVSELTSFSISVIINY